MVDPCPEIHHTLLSYHPPVGTWIAGLAFLGVLVPLFRSWEKIGRKEQAFWTVLMFALVILEIRTLYVDRSEHDAEQRLARCQELQRFEAIATSLQNSINSSQEHFNQTIAHLDSLLDSTKTVARIAKQNLDDLTGGDSYCYLVHVFPESEFLDSQNGRHISHAFGYFVKRGEHPLYGVHATTVVNNSIAEYDSLPDFSRGAQDEVLSAPFSFKERLAFGKKTFHLKITYRSRNGAWEQVIDEIQKDTSRGPVWFTKTTVSRQGKVLFEKDDDVP